MQMEQLHAELITGSKTNCFFLAVCTMMIILLTFARGTYLFYSNMLFQLISYTDSHKLHKNYGQLDLQ